MDSPSVIEELESHRELVSVVSSETDEDEKPLLACRLLVWHVKEQGTSEEHGVFMHEHIFQNQLAGPAEGVASWLKDDQPVWEQRFSL